MPEERLEGLLLPFGKRSIALTVVKFLGLDCSFDINPPLLTAASLAATLAVGVFFLIYFLA